MRARSHMPLLLIAMVLAACAGGTSTKPQLSAERRQALIDIATRELQRQKLPLPRKYDVDVEEGFYQAENEPRRSIMCVMFRFWFRGAKDTVYMVTFDRGRVEASDYRFVVPLDPSQ